MSKRIQCSMCLKMAQPSRRDAVICADCSLKLYTRLSAATGEDIDGIALLEAISAKHKHKDSPADVAAGDGERVYANEVFEVSRALD
jgi:hypothetical protein